MKLVPSEKRIEKLLEAGFDPTFLETIDHSSQIDFNLQSVITFPEGAYYYLPTISEYAIFEGYEVIPIGDVSQGDSFFTLLSNNLEQKIIYSEIEQDEIYLNFGMNFKLFSAHLLINYYELMDDIHFEQPEVALNIIAEMGEILGLDKSLAYQIGKTTLDTDLSVENRFNANSDWFERKIGELVRNNHGSN